MTRKIHGEQGAGFNYSGVPIAKLILDKRIYQMALCTKLHKIIGLGNLPEPAFVSFDVVFRYIV